MAEHEVGQLSIGVDIDDAAALAKLRALAAAGESTARQIDRQDASIDINTDSASHKLTQFFRTTDNKLRKFERNEGRLDIEAVIAVDKDEIDKIKRTTKQIRGEIADITKGKKKLNDEEQKLVDKLKDELDYQNKLKDIAEGRLATLEKQRKAHDNQNKVIEEAIALEEAREKALSDAYGAELRFIEQRKKKRDRDAKQQETDLRTLARQQDQAYRLDAKRGEDRERQIRVLAALQMAAYAEDAKLEADKERRVRTLASLQMAAYAEDAKRTNDKEASERRMAGYHAEALRMDGEREVKIARMQKRYTELQKTLGDIDRTRLPFDRYKALKLRLDKNHVMAEMAAIKTALEVEGRTPPVDIETRLSRSFVGATFAKGADWASSLADTTVRIGPFTTTVKKAMIALTLLGSAIVDVGAAAVSLVGVFGTGLVGTAAVATSGLIGMGLAFGGVYAAIKPLAGEYKQLSQLSASYDRAVASYGKNSKQAKTAQDKLNTAMKQADPNVRSAIRSMSAAGQEWGKLTDKMARESFGSILKESMGTWRSLIPTFASVTNETLGVLAYRLDSFMKMLRSDESKASLKTIGTNFNAGLRPALGGLREFTQYLLRVATSASRSLEPLGKWFKNWATGLNDAAGNTSRLNESMDRLASHAKSVFRFFGSLGRLLMTVLNGSADAGQNLADTMSNAFDRWNEALKKPGGQKSMSKFFHDAAAGAKALWSALAPILQIFVQWSQIFSPVMSAFAKGLGEVAQMASKLLGVFTQFEGGRGALGILGAIYGLRKLSNMVNTMRTGGLGGSVAAGGRVAGASIGSAMVGAGARVAAMIRTAMGGIIPGRGVTPVPGGRGTTVAPLPAGGKAAEQTARTVASTSRLARAGALAGTAFAGLASALGLSTAALAGLTALSAGYGIGKLITMKSASEKLADSIDKVKTRTKDWSEAQKISADVMTGTAQAYGGLRRANDQNIKAKKHLTDLEERGYASAKKGTKQYEEYRAAVSRVAETSQAAIDSQKAHQQGLEASQEAARNNLKYIKEIPAARETANKAQDEATKAQEKYNKAIGENRHLYTDKDRSRLKQEMEDAQAIALSAGQAYDLLRQKSRDYSNLSTGAQFQTERWLKGLPALTEKAQISMGRLANTMTKAFSGRKVASAINRDPTYTDPRDAGRVANAAAAAGKAGASQKIVLKIIADSKSAEEAIRRLRNARLEAKYLKVAEKGGKGVLDMLKDIGGMKLVNKSVKILASDSSAKKKIADLIALGIPPKIAKAMVNDDSAKRTLRSLERTVVKPLQQIVNRLLGRDVPRTVPAATQLVFRKVKNTGDTLAGEAAGGYGRSRKAIVGEGRRWQDGGAKELIANNRTGAITMVQGAQHVSLSRNDYVIPIQDQAHLGRGQRLWDSFNADMGRGKSALPRFDKGKKALTGKGATDKQKASFRDKGRERISKVRKKNRPTKNTLALTWVNTMNSRRAKEDDERDRVAVLDRRISDKEPDTYLKVVGKDPFTGDDIFDLDYEKINGWQTELQTLANAYENLYKMVEKTLDAARKAKEQVTTKLQRFGKNRSTILDLMDGAKSAANKAKTKMGKDRATERYKVYKEALKEEDAKISAAKESEKGVDTEIHDAGDMSRGRIADSYDDWQKVKGDLDAVSVEAGKALSDSQAAPQFQDPLSAAQAADELSTARGQLSELSAVADQMSPTKKAIFDAASSYLTDDRTDNDSAGISAIGSLYSDMFSGSGSSGGDSAAADRAVAQAANATAEAQRNASALATFQGYGDIGSGGLNAYNAAGGAPVININTLHPGDPSVYRAIGNAAATGFGYQNGIGTSRGVVG